MFHIALIVARKLNIKTIDQIVDKILDYGEKAKVVICAPVARARKGEYTKQLESYRKRGYLRVQIDGINYSLDTDEINLDKNIKHTISVIIDRLIIKEGINKRLSDSVETALKLSEGLVEVQCEDKKQLFSINYACPDCDISLEELTPRMFSFNSPFGACPKCHGLGFNNVIDVNKIVKDWNKSIKEGAFDVSGWNLDTSRISKSVLTAVARDNGFSINTPVKDLPKNIINLLMYGDADKEYEMSYTSSTFSGAYKMKFEGIANNLLRRYNETSSDFVKQEIERYMKTEPCDLCHGKRLKKEVLSVTLAGLILQKFAICRLLN